MNFEKINFKNNNELIRIISSLQSNGTKHFEEGLFRVQRLLPFFLYYRDDENIYYPTLISLILQDVQKFSDEDDKQLIKKITNKIEKNFDNYKNRKGENTYGFYKTKPGGHYSHGLLLSKFDSLKLPDDADDTCLIYLAKQNKNEDIIWLKEKLAHHANLKRGRKVKKTLPKYQTLQAYSTWFGSDKVYVDFDICVMCNIMKFILENNLPLNNHDFDTLQFIESTILSDEYIYNTFIVSPWYPNPIIIAYHISRLLVSFKDTYFIKVKTKIIKDLKIFLLNSKSYIEYTIISTSLLKLGIKTAKNPFPNPTLKEIKKFSWGVTPILYTIDFIYNFKNKHIKKLVASQPLNYQFRCIAHVFSLILENNFYEKLNK